VSATREPSRSSAPRRTASTNRTRFTTAPRASPARRRARPSPPCLPPGAELRSERLDGIPGTGERGAPERLRERVFHRISLAQGMGHGWACVLPAHFLALDRRCFRLLAFPRSP
jgi:hypothetical protein